MKSIIILLTASLLFTGCASLNSLSLTSIPAKKGRPVFAQTSKLIFLGFNFDNDFVEDIQKQLQTQCRDGEIRGILTKDEVFNYFLVWKHQITAEGQCLTERKTASEGV